MGIRSKSIIVLASIILITTIFCCDNADKPAVNNDEDVLWFAPSAPDQLIYACESTMTYHYANCQRLTPDKVVMLKSEAVLLDYKPCEMCFPQDRVIIENTYITADGYYHRFLCPLLYNVEKNIIPKADAINQGYKPCPVCAIDIIISIPGIPVNWVYVCPAYGEVYHGLNCPYLNNCISVLSYRLTEVPAQFNRPCSLCNGEYYKKQ